MVDISKTIVAKSDQLNAGDLIGGGVTVTIERVEIRHEDQPISIFLREGYQPFKPCLSMRRVIAKLWGLETDNWVGRRLTLFCDPSVMWAGKREGGIRISHMDGIKTKIDIPLRASKHKVAIYTIEPLQAQQSKHNSANIDAIAKSMNACTDMAALEGIAKTIRDFNLQAQEKETLAAAYRQKRSALEAVR